MSKRQTNLILLFSILGSPLLLGQETSVDANASSQIGYGKAFMFGVVEGITEFLPISSTGHLILVNQVMHGGAPLGAEQQEAVNAYLVIIQAGAILAVAFIYFGQIIKIIRGFLGMNPDGRKLGLNLLAAFTPAAFLGLLLDDLIESFLFGSLPVALALLLGSMLMYWAESRKRKKEKLEGLGKSSFEDLTWKNALVIGFLQCVAMCPGTSRSMMTIVGGYLVGLTRAKAAEFSFLLGLITLSAAAGYKAFTKQEAILQNLDWGPLLFGCLVAGVFAALSVRWLVGYLGRHGLGVFIIYRLVLGAIVLGFFFLQ